MGWQEGPVEKYLVERVTASGGSQRKVKWIGRDGAPDRLVWWRFPVVAFVECKGPHGRYEASQEREMARLEGDGWPVYTVRSKADVDALVGDLQLRASLL